MSVLIVNKPLPGTIVYARIGFVIEGRRYLHVHRRRDDGTEHDELTLLKPSPNKKMTVVPNLAGDLDDSYLHDIVESVEGRKDGIWHYEKDVTKTYHEFNAMRAAELRGEHQFAMNMRQEPNGNAD